MKKDFRPPLGRVEKIRVDSRLLRDNPLGDPHERDLLVWLAPDYTSGPLLVDLVGYTGSGASHTNWRPFGLNLVERLERMHADGRIGPCVVALPDCFTALGGNQYVNSTAIGPYLDHLCEEILPLLQARYGTGLRGVFGKSSGGYGALMQAMLRPDAWQAAACHSGDMGFEWVYFADFPRVLRELQKTGGDPKAWLEKVWAKEKLSSDEGLVLMALGMAATYDPDPGSALGFRLPFDPRNGRLDEAAWARWLRHDPVRIAATHAEALRGLRLLWLECGTKDQFHLLWGARQLHEELDRLGVAHRYEEFDDDHSDIDYRMERSLPAMYAALRGA